MLTHSCKRGLTVITVLCVVPVSNQLLKEMNLLEIQFEIERSCRESAEALAVKAGHHFLTLTVYSVHSLEMLAILVAEYFS